MRRSLLITLICVGSVLCGLIAGCKKEAAKSVTPPTVTVMQPVAKEVTRYLEYPGTTEAFETVEIRARVPGFLESINFQPRQKVKSGDLLFVIDPRQYDATVRQSQARLDAQKSGLKLAQIELKMAQQLESKEAISGLKLDKKVAESEKSSADVDLSKADLDKAKLDLEWSRVTSPVNGRVSRNLVDVGNLVGSTEKTLLTTVINDDSIYAYFYLSELDLLETLKASPKASSDTSQSYKHIPVYMSLANENGFPHNGHLDFVDTKLDPSTGTIQCRAIFSNPNGTLFPGMFVRLRIPSDKKMALLVPDVAVQFDQGGSYVLVVDSHNNVEMRKIKSSQTEDNMSVIEEGLNQDDRVITKGLQRARPGSVVNPVSTR